MGISVWDVIDAVSKKPFGFMPFYPSSGTGGHCIPLDPYYLASKARDYDFRTRFIELAAEINEQMPDYITSRIEAALKAGGKNLKGATLLVLGVTYKKDLEDLRESPALKLIQLLREKGAGVSYNDPYIEKIQVDKDTMTSVKLNEESLSTTDCVVIATNHSHYDYQHIADKVSLIFDSRGATRELKNSNIVRL